MSGGFDLHRCLARSKRHAKVRGIEKAYILGLSGAEDGNFMPERKSLRGARSAFFADNREMGRSRTEAAHIDKTDQARENGADRPPLSI
jgi:hypothetical protein